MLMGPTDDGWRNFIGLLAPRLGALPAIRCHEIKQHFSDRQGWYRGRLWPGEMFGILTPESDKHYARAQLGDTEIRCVHELPSGLIAELLQLSRHMVAVIFENGSQDAADILDHDGLGANQVYQPNHGWKKIPLVFDSELFSGDGKWRARQAS